MYFCYNLEKEEGSLKTELKNCLSLYKIFYSCAFILILCAIHPIIYYEEIGSAIQSPIAFLTIIFCSDTYLMEVKVSVPMYFICMIKKAVKSNIAESGRSNIIFINTFLCWICFVFLAKTGQCKRRHFGYSDISFIFHCNVWNYLALEYMLCDFVYIASKYVGRYWMFIWNCHWTYIKSGKFIFRKSGIVFFQLL